MDKKKTIKDILGDEKDDCDCESCAEENKIRAEVEEMEAKCEDKETVMHFYIEARKIAVDKLKSLRICDDQIEMVIDMETVITYHELLEKYLQLNNNFF